jgi:hypothetical protein
MSGCGDLLSLHSLSSGKDQVFDTALEGRWENDNSVLQVKREDDAYAVTMQSKHDSSETTNFEMHLVDLGGVRFADLLPEDSFGHMILRVRVIEGQLRVAFFDSEWLRRQAPHQDADLSNHRKQAVLTVDTARLRKLVAKYAHEPRAYDEETGFRRM